MAVVGTAYVTIRAITDTIKRDIDRALSGATGNAQKQGTKFGRDFSRGFRSGLPDLSTAVQRSIGNGFDNGVRYGEQFGRGARRGFTAATAGGFDVDTRSIADSIADSMRDGANRGRRSVDSAISAAGGGAGRSGRRAGLDFAANFNNGLRGISSSPLANLITVGQLAGSAILAAVGAVSALVSGLGAVVGAAAQASAALIVIPMALGAIAQAAGTMVAAFRGVGAAISAGNEAAKGSAASSAAITSASRSIVAAQRAVRDATQGVTTAQREARRASEDAADRTADAQQRLARVTVESSRAVRDALRDVADAEDDLADAQRNLLSVQRSLNAAREEAAEQLQQLQFSAEGAALAERRAAIQLEEAQAALANASSLPPNNKLRREAELAFAEADLNYREAKDRVADLTVEQERAAAAGIDGSAEVLRVQDQIADAQQNVLDRTRALADARESAAETEVQAAEDVRDAEEALTDARQNQADVAVQNAERIRDANERLTDAQDRLREAQVGLNNAINGGSTGVDKFAEAMANLSAPAQNFVRQMIALQPAFRALRDAAAAGLFATLGDDITRVVNGPLFAMLLPALTETGRAIGYVAGLFADLFTDTTFVENLATIMQGNSDFIRTIGPGLVDLAEAFSLIFVAAQPLFDRFGEFIAREAGQFLDFITRMSADGSLTEFFNNAGDAMGIFADLFAEFGGLMTTIFAAGADTGLGLVASLSSAMGSFNDFLNTAAGNTALQDFFRDVGTNVRAIAPLVGGILAEFVKLGADPSVQEFATILREQMLPNLGSILQAAQDATPAFAKFMVAVSDLLARLAESGALTAFVETLTFLVDIAETVVQWIGPELIGQILALAGAFKAVTIFARFTGLAAFAPLLMTIGKLVGGPLIKGVKALVGGLKLVWGAISLGATLAGGWSVVFSRMWLALTGPIGLVIAGIVAVIAVAVLLYKKWEPFRNLIDTIAKKFVEGWNQIVAGAQWLWDVLFGNSIIPDLINAFGEWFGKIIGFIRPPLEAVWNFIVNVFDGLKEIVGNIIGAVVTVIKFYINLWITAFRIGLAGLKLIFNSVLKPIFDFVISVVKSAVDVVIAIWDGLKEGFRLGMAGLRLIFDTVFRPIFSSVADIVQTAVDTISLVWAGLGAAFQWVTDNIIKPVFDGFATMVNLGIGTAQFIFDAVKTAWDLMALGFKWAYDNVIKPVINFVVDTINKARIAVAIAFLLIKLGWDQLGAAFRFVVDRVIKPVFEAVKAAVISVWTKANEIFTFIKNAWSALGTALGIAYNTYILPIFDKVKSGFQSLWDKAEDVVEGIKTVFNKLKDAPMEGIRGIIKLFNDNLIGNLNKVTSTFGFTIPNIPTFAQGGYVRGRGGPKDDKILARLSNREFVVNARATSMYRPVLEAINSGKHANTIKPVGGWNPFADIVDGVMGLISKGAGYALENIVNPFVERFIPKGTFVGDFTRAIIPKWIEALKKWGDERDKTFVPEGNFLGPARSGAYGGVMPHVAQVGDYIAKRFGVKNIGGYGYRPNPTDHSRGLALDFMTYDNKTLGDQILNFLLAARERLAIKYLIFFDKIYSSINNWRARAYTHPNGPTRNPTLRHLDHVHASFYSRSGPIPLARGGVVRATNGGVLAQIAEAGRSERVTPLDNDGLSAGERMVLAALRENRGDVITVQADAGLAANFAKGVAQEIVVQQRRHKTMMARTKIS